MPEKDFVNPAVEKTSEAIKDDSPGQPAEAGNHQSQAGAGPSAGRRPAREEQVEFLIDLERILAELESDDRRARKEAAELLREKAGLIVSDDEIMIRSGETLMRSAEGDHDLGLREAVLEALKEIWKAGWASRQQTTFDQALRALECTVWEIRQAAVENLAENVATIAQKDRLVGQALDALIHTANEDPDPHVKVSAWEASKRFWQTGWDGQKEIRESYQLAVFTRFLRALKEGDEDGDDWEIRQAAADWLRERAKDIALNDRMVADALETLIASSQEEAKGDLRKSVYAAIKNLWNEGWETPADLVDQETRRATLLNQLKSALSSEDSELQQAAADWLGDKAADIARLDKVVDQVLEALIDRTEAKSEMGVRLRALSAIAAIWNQGWQAEAPANRPAVLEQALRGLKKEDEEGREFRWIRQAAADWLGDKAKDIGQDAKMVKDTLSLLLKRAKEDEKHPGVHRSAREASKKIWDEAWENQIVTATTFAPDSKQPVTAQESREARENWRLFVLNYVLKAFEENVDQGFRQIAASWLSDKAASLAESDRMVSEALKHIIKWVKIDPETEAVRGAIEASKRIWNAGLAVKDNLEVRRRVVLGQLLKASEEKFPCKDAWEFKQAAFNWLEDKAKEVAEDYDLAEKVAGVLDKTRQDGSQPDDLRDSAERAIAALWEALRKRYSLDGIKKGFDTQEENEKIREIRQLANENTLGSREAASFLVKKWVEWIREETELPLVEISAVEMRANHRVILPLVEQFMKNWDEPQRGFRPPFKIELNLPAAKPTQDQQESQAKKQLRARRRIARQLADMSDPRFYNDPELAKKRDVLLQEMRDHAVPALLRWLPEEKDVEILENMVRTLLYTQEREAIDAVAREVAGEERTRKARQDLLAEYYLEPSKRRSEEAAEILNNAIQNAKGTLRLLQVMNIWIITVGLLAILFGLSASILSAEWGNRVVGGLAALGGFIGVIHQLIRDPMNRIQKASSNLVHMETAFTSFIWELNLNGTYIQSSYVDDGLLEEKEVAGTAERIKKAAELTMNLVSIYTGSGKQRLVTRLHRLEPAAGPPGSKVTVLGQHLLGERREQNVAGDQQDGRSARPAARQKNGQTGMLAINHLPVDGGVMAWKEEAVEFILPQELSQGQPLPETVLISLFVNGIETNALPFHLIAPR